MDKFDVTVKRKNCIGYALEFSDVDEFSLLGLINVLYNQENIEYFTVLRKD